MWRLNVIPRMNNSTKRPSQNGSDVEEQTVPVDGVELLMVVKQHEEAETGGSPDAH